MKLILKNGTTVPYKNGMGLTGLDIDSIVAESKEDRADLRMLLMGALKVDEGGCHQLGRGFGSNALATNPDMSNGSYALGVVLDSNQDSHLDGKLKIIEALTSALNYGDNIGSINRDLLSLKLKSVIDDL
ncbi:hypothetical protein [Acinetobacter bohemicus]|uniref:hypothetical protein n=1 Tax=Acinetobacter bohemicus TaxID=1435036 RepID=UPI00192A799F|nr:hypothetical protein [Acinetobacter bohemicus]CAD9197253.1 hypothetical protein QAC21B_03423 [Acinetobacter bohemicus]